MIELLFMLPIPHYPSHFSLFCTLYFRGLKFKDMKGTFFLIKQHERCGERESPVIVSYYDKGNM